MTIESALFQRSSSSCELCSATSGLSAYHILPQGQANEGNCLLLCQKCTDQVEGREDLDINHWFCLRDSMWSEFPPVQVMAWRMLHRLSDQEWALDLFGQMYLEDVLLNWAKEGINASEGKSEATQTRDSNGTVLAEGDSVTLIKDLPVKGAGFTAKRGTLVKNISLTSNPEQIEGKVGGMQIVLLTQFLKKA